MSKIKAKAAKLIIVIGKKMANIDVNTTCPWINYQPQEPIALQRERKNKK